MMKESKKIAEANGILIAGILTDSAIMEKKTKPILSFEERLEIAKSIKYIDKVISQEAYSPLENLNKIKPDILDDINWLVDQSFTKGRMDNNIVELTKNDVHYILKSLY